MTDSISLGTFADFYYVSDCASCEVLKYLVRDLEWEDSRDLIVLRAVLTIQRLEWTIDAGTQKQRVGLWPRSRHASLLCATRWSCDKASRSLEAALDSPLMIWAAVAVLDERHRNQRVHVAARRKSEVLDLALLRTWLSLCDEHHANACKPNNWDLSLKDVTFIDVKERRVVRSYETIGEQRRYFCLSYVWGGVKQQNCRLGPLPKRLPRTV